MSYLQICDLLNEIKENRCMAVKFSKILFTITVTAPTFFSLALTGIVKIMKVIVMYGGIFLRQNVS